MELIILLFILSTISTISDIRQDIISEVLWSLSIL